MAERLEAARPGGSRIEPRAARAARREMMPMRPRGQTQQAVAWITSRCPRIDLAVREWRNGRAVWIHPDRPRGRHFADLDHQGVEQMLPMLRARNAHGGDIFWRPARGGAALVLLDDLIPALALRIACKYSALVIETSSGNTQVWIMLDHLRQEAERHAIQAELICRTGADPGAGSGVQLGRLPGFRNRKPSHPTSPWCNLLAATGGTPLSISPRAAARAARGSMGRGDGVGGRGPSPRPRAGGSESEADWAIACSMIKAGIDTASIIERITRRATRRNKRPTPDQCREYATRTVLRAGAGEILKQR